MMRRSTESVGKSVDPGNVVRQKKPPAIVLGAHKIGLGIIRSLGREGVPVCSVYYHDKDMGQVSKYVIGKYRCPHPEKDEEQFLKFLSDLDHPGGLLIPSDDASLMVVSRNRERLEKRYVVLSPDDKITQICVDKKHTYELAEKIGVRSPRTLVTEDPEEAEIFAGEIGFPILLKPSVSHHFFDMFHVKMMKLNDASEMKSLFKQLKGCGVEMMVQEFIPGDDTCGTNYNSFAIDGEPVCEFTARKWRLSPPGTGFPRVIVSEDIQEIHEPGRKILSALNFQGFSCIEFKKDIRSGKYVLMEINPRMNLSSQHAVRCGYNFPYLAYHKAMFGELIAFPRNFQKGVFWIDPGKDLIESIRSYRKERFALSSYVIPYFRRNVFTLPSWRDPMPSFKRMGDGIKMLMERIINNIRSD
jgi:predicted ATP-grasp superfamily ATP-dependent carboligase